MLRVHHVTLKELEPIGITEIPSGPMRLADVTEEPDMKAAQVVVIPIPLREHDWLTPRQLHKFIAHYGLDERRVTAFDCSDFEADYGDLNPNALYVRCNGTKSWMHRRMPRTLAWPWPVDDLGTLVQRPDGGWRYDAGAHIWSTSCNVRQYVVSSCQSVLGDKADIRAYTEFYGYVHRDRPADAAARRQQFLDCLRDSRVQLCPRSIAGVMPYRLYETMSAGRVAMLWCSDYVLPWANRIDWDSCIVRFDDQQASNAGGLVKSWLDNHNDDQIAAMGMRAREAWHRWLNPARWSSLWTEAIEEKLRLDHLI